MLFKRQHRTSVVAALALLFLETPRVAEAQALYVSVGAQYDSTHVYLAQGDLDAFVTAFTSTFGGSASKRAEGNVLPVPSHATLQYVFTPVGTLSLFEFNTPIPYPFGQERTGWLVTDLDAAIAAARASGAELVVAPYQDVIGRDAVVRWPGGVATQLYWHFNQPSAPPLTTIPDNRVYVSSDAADVFLNSFLRFSHGSIESDEGHADAGEIGRPGEFYRRVRISSGFGRMQVMVTDGHLPFPFGRELTGYQVEDIVATLARAQKNGAVILSRPYVDGDRVTAMLGFPGGYIAEIHAARTH